MEREVCAYDVFLERKACAELARHLGDKPDEI